MLRFAENNPDRLDYLLKRRSTPIKLLGAPGPDTSQIETLVRAGARVPDHGRLTPWHFMVISGDARAALDETVRDIFAKKHPHAPHDVLAIEQARFTRAPVVIAVISRPQVSEKVPAWEQILSVGAACHSLCMAAGAMGFGAVWLTEWLAYDDDVKDALGCKHGDHIAGFIHVGTPTAAPEERERPALEAILSWFGR